MNILEAIEARHSVRRYTDKKIEGEVLQALIEEIAQCNAESGLNIQLITDEPEAFSGPMAHYGHFSGVTNYIALVGKKQPNFDELVGYYGERIVLKAQMLGLNTCWVALTYSKGKSKCKIEKGEKLSMVISVGYGKNRGRAHTGKPIEELYKADGEIPDWFRRGMVAAEKAPTATNQQKFLFTLSGNTVKAKAMTGFYSKVDLGIVKYHFEVAAGKENFNWA
ncbi:MAG: nitroreductase [Clostridia bacterium]|nr:nitroreductase [Clostridia bacterium]